MPDHAVRKPQAKAQQPALDNQPGVVAPLTVDPETAARRLQAQRYESIAVRAYFLAEARGFAPGAELEDWLAAEQQEDAAERPL